MVTRDLGKGLQGQVQCPCCRVLGTLLPSSDTTCGSWVLYQAPGGKCVTQQLCPNPLSQGHSPTENSRARAGPELAREWVVGDVTMMAVTCGHCQDKGPS